MQLSNLLGILLIVGIVEAAIKCNAGNTAKYSRQQLSVCTSGSYCVSVKHKSGVLSYSCDGNSYNQLALCTLFKAKNPANDYFYASQIGASSTNGRASRQMVADREQNCYDGGDLGQICCCNSDYCNSASTFSLLLSVIVTLISLH